MFLTIKEEQNYHHIIKAIANKAIRVELSNYYKLLAYLTRDRKL
jgi:translation initiation factor IF-1